MARMKHTRWESPSFYSAESRTYTGPWNVYLDAELATDLAQKVMERMGEESIDISLHAGAQHHEGGKDGVRLRTYNFTLIDVCHELAHVVHERNAKQEPKNWHDYVAWNLVALITCVMCDVLDGKRK